MRKKNDINVEDVSGTSQYDGMNVLRDSHSLPGHYIRTKESLTVVQSYFDSFDVVYDGNLPEIVEYYAGTSAHLTTIGVVGDSSGSLESKYILVSSGRKEAKYAFYFTVDGNGSAPSIANTIEVEVPISENDPASVVSYALQLAILSVGKVFDVDRTNAVLRVRALKLGITNNTLDGGTGFAIQNTPGTREKVDTVRLTYSNQGFPIWQGQELKDHKYNIYTARFELDEAFEIELETTASNFTIEEVAIPTAGTPVTINVPNGTKQFALQAKNSSSIINVVDTTNNTEFTLRYGVAMSFDNLNTFNVSFDVKSNKDNNTIELLLWE